MRSRRLLGVATMLSIAAATLPAQAEKPAEVEPFYAQHGCAKGYTRKDARAHIRRAVLAERGVKRYIVCAHSKRSSRKLRWYFRRYRAAHIWQIRFNRMPAAEQAWARRVTSCESEWDRNVVNGSGHYSYFQWALETWRAAGGKGDPRSVPWHHQAVLAIRWKWREGASQWDCH